MIGTGFKTLRRSESFVELDLVWTVLCRHRMHAYRCRAYGYLYLYRYIGRIGLFDHSVVRNYLACDSAERENRWGRRRGQRWRSLRRWWRGVSHGRIASESLLDLACVGITCMRPFRRRMANPLGGDTHGA